MKSLNSFISIIFTLFILIFLVSCQDNKAVTTEGIVFERIEGKNEYTILGYTGTSQNIIIAETYNNLPVTKVSVDAFRDLDIEILSIDLPDSIVELERFSLDSLKLTQFKIPKNLKYFAQAFGQFKETKFIIPSDHLYLMERTINGYLSIITKDENELIYVYNTVNYDAVYKIPDYIKTIGHSAFMYTTFQTVILSNSIESIESMAFFETKSTYFYLNFPHSLKNMGEAAFYKSNLPTELLLPTNLTVLDAYVFADSNIESIILPLNLSYLHYSAFSNSSNGSNNYNKIKLIEFTSFNLSEDNLNDFTNLFAYMTFRYGYNTLSLIQIVLPKNQIQAIELKNALETSLDTAKTIHNDFPEIVFEFIDSND
jgi:hypothetical protein